MITLHLSWPVLSNISRGGAIVNIGGGFWALHHAQFHPIWRDFPPQSDMMAPHCGRYGGILAFRPGLNRHICRRQT